MKDKIICAAGIIFAALYAAVPAFADVIAEPEPIEVLGVVSVFLIGAVILIAAGVLVWKLIRKKEDR